MDRNEFEKLKFDHMVNTFVNQELFAQWLRNFFYLNHELHKEYDTIYQSTFYVKFHELITVGIDYTEKALKHLANSENQEKIEFYKELKRGLLEFKSEFSESEIEFIEYKRHSSSHIFQHHYENRLLDNGKIQTKRKRRLIDELSRDFQEILVKYGFDRGFDEYMTSKLYPKITRLYDNLEAIKKKSEENVQNTTNWNKTMKLYTTCINCQKEFSKWFWVSDRVEMKKSNGDFVELECKNCNQTGKYKIDNLKARESKIAMIVGILIFLIGTPIILILLWDYIWTTGVYGVICLLSIVLVPSIVYGIMNKNETNRVRIFNRS